MTWILTRSGRQFNYVNPTQESICIEDIAEALSKECRYNGHCRGFYSVAQHSEYCSRIVPPDLAMEALLHDAAEAYIKDIPRPLKQLMPEYGVVEHRVEQAIRWKFSLPHHPDPLIKMADNIMLLTERRDLMPEHHVSWEQWAEGASAAPFKVRPYWHWRWTYYRFMRRFYELGGRREEN